MPAMRYASDESDTDAEASPAAKKKGRRAKKGKGESDDAGTASPARRRSKGRRKAAEEVHP